MSGFNTVLFLLLRKSNDASASCLGETWKLESERINVKKKEKKEKSYESICEFVQLKITGGNKKKKLIKATIAVL